MSAIRVLSPEIAERIAAGEVVERPASVVKELVENALDSGAIAIRVEIGGGGAGLVRVSDNGGGMARDDAPLALERFSTSKIYTPADLESIRTLGFRGEALAAIAAVAHVTILTRQADELEGTRVTATAGQMTVEPAASPAGCSVAVSDLFYNTPARRKFLKSPRREVELCQQAVLRYALAYPHVAFHLTVDGQVRLVAPPGTLIERAALAVGRETAGALLSISWEAGDLRLRGLIGSPEVGRSRRDRQYFALNGRPIRSGLLAVMLERPYAGRLPPRRYPPAIVHLEIDPAAVDVNVHPRKAEVRFSQERAVYQAVSQAVGAALAPFPIHEAWGTTGWPFPETPTAPILVAEGSEAYAAGQQIEALGQVQATYIVARSASGLTIVDQHAAHEAILTERLLASSAATPLTPPPRLELTEGESELVDAYCSLFADLGLELEAFGGRSYLVRALPAPLTEGRESLQDADTLLAELLEELAASRGLDPGPLRERLASRAACRAALKAGDVLSLEQQQSLLDDLAAAWSPSTCPHGRPALFTLTVEEMERRFLR